MSLITYELGYTTSFIVYNASIYDKLLSFEKEYRNMNSSNYKTTRDAIDVRLNGIPNIIKLTHCPILTAQLPGYSDLCGKIVNHTSAFQASNNAMKKFIMTE